MSSPAATAYDPEQTRARNLQDARKRITALEHNLNQAIRLLATTAQLAAGPNLDPLTVLAIAELINDHQPQPIEHTRLLELLGGP